MDSGSLSLHLGEEKEKRKRKKVTSIWRHFIMGFRKKEAKCQTDVKEKNRRREDRRGDEEKAAVVVWLVCTHQRGGLDGSKSFAVFIIMSLSAI